MNRTGGGLIKQPYAILGHSAGALAAAHFIAAGADAALIDSSHLFIWVDLDPLVTKIRGRRIQYRIPMSTLEDCPVREFVAEPRPVGGATEHRRAGAVGTAEHVERDLLGELPARFADDRTHNDFGASVNANADRGR